MKKFLSSAFSVGECDKSKMEMTTTPDNEIRISATNADESGGNGHIKIPDGSAIQVDAKISAGKLIIDIDDKEYEIDKTGESFIDVPPGKHDCFSLPKTA